MTMSAPPVIAPAVPAPPPTIIHAAPSIAGIPISADVSDADDTAQQSIRQKNEQDLELTNQLAAANRTIEDLKTQNDILKTQINQDTHSKLLSENAAEATKVDEAMQAEKEKQQARLDARLDARRQNTRAAVTENADTQQQPQPPNTTAHTVASIPIVAATLPAVTSTPIGTGTTAHTVASIPIAAATLPSAVTSMPIPAGRTGYSIINIPIAPEHSGGD